MQDNYTLILELDIKNLDSKIQDFIDKHNNDLESELIREKYIERSKKLNVRQYSKVYKCPQKKVFESMEKAERKLYTFLLNFV